MIEPRGTVIVTVLPDAKNVGVHGSAQGKTEGSRESDIRKTGDLLLSMITKVACFPGFQGVNAYQKTNPGTRHPRRDGTMSPKSS